MRVKLKYFGMISEALGFSEEEFVSPNKMDLNHLVDSLKDKYSQLNKLNFSVAVNQEITISNTLLEDQYEVALLPPFAGG